MAKLNRGSKKNLAGQEILLETDQDFATYGRARSEGLSSRKAFALVKIKRLAEKEKEQKVTPGRKRNQNSVAEKKIQKYLDKYGEFEAYNSFGGKSIDEGVRRMESFYRQHPDAPV